MATKAIIGWSFLAQVNSGNSPEDWFTLGEVKSASPPNQQTDNHEATHMQSPGRKKEFIPGMTDPSETTLTVNNVPGSATDLYVAAWRASGETRQVRFIYPLVKGETLRRTETFDAFVTGYAPTLETNAVSEATLTLKISGDSTFDTITPILAGGVG